jgi:nitrate/TMAO reductase-like tetraheme cytochrome c subunit
MSLKNKILGVIGILIFIFLGSYISSCSESDPSPAEQTITYDAHIKPLIASRCTPCHLPPDGFKKLFNTYDAAKQNIDEMIKRIQLPASDTLSMPWKRAKLSNDEIQKFIKWKSDGLLEK